MYVPAPSGGSGRPEQKIRWKRILIIAAIAVGVLVLAGGILWTTGSGKAIAAWTQNIFDSGDSSVGVVSPPGGGADHLGNSGAPETPADPPVYSPSHLARGAWLVPGKDFLTPGAESPDAAKAAVDAAIASCEGYKFNMLVVPLNYNGGLITPAVGFLPDTSGGDLLGYMIEKAHASGMTVAAVIDLTAAAGGNLDLSNPDQLVKSAETVRALGTVAGLDGLLLDGYYYGAGAAPYGEYARLGGGMGYDNYLRDKLSFAMERITSSAKEANGNLYLGLLADSVWAKASSAEGGFETSGTVYEALTDGHADTLDWLKNKYFDWVMVKNYASTADGSAPFAAVAAWWTDHAGGSAGVYFSQAADKVLSKEAGWGSADQLMKQMVALKNLPVSGSAFYHLSALTSDGTGSTSALMKYLSGTVGDDYVLTNLSFSTPAKTTFTTHEPTVTIIGASDPEFPLTMNGQAVERSDKGYFSLQLNLAYGLNTFSFSHKGQTVDYKITYKKIIIKDVAPAANQTLDGGSVMIVKATALAGSTVTASLNGTAITLNEQPTLDEAGNQVGIFNIYTGSFVLPSGLSKNKSIGAVTFTAKNDGQTETKTGGKITVRATKAPAVDLPPFTGGPNDSYINVGNSLIAEVVPYQIETFDGNLIDDRSRPTNNYLPAGTVDYCSQSVITDTGSGSSYRLLRYGKRVYTNCKNKGDNIKVYGGTLPETNTITANSVSDDGRFTTMVFDTQWKAPFRFTLAPQGYANPYPKKEAPNYTINSATYQYVDITFCYAVSAQGKVEIPADNPVFSRAEWIKNEADYSLRLYLKKAGGFYGWNAEYNAAGQLVFTFLKPAKLQTAGNSYGVSLDGVKIVVDPGHGGKDPGALGANPNFTEAVLNLKMAQAVKSRLESLGASVTMTRTGDSFLDLDPRVRTVKSVKPDLFISLHRNASPSPSARGYEDFYFNPFSRALAQAVYDQNAPLYSNGRGFRFGNFYVMRVSDCPAILSENGFVSNKDEYGTLITDSFNDKIADATVTGIVNYLKSIQ